MITDLFPRIHRQYTESPVASWLIEFADWLESAGYAHDPAHDHVRRLRQVLERQESVAPDTNFSLAELTKMFTSSARQQPVFRGTQHAFEKLLTGRGQLIIEPDSNRFQPLLDSYRHHLIDARGLATVTVKQHLATASAFLAQSVPQGTSLLELSAQAVERFVIATSLRMKRQSLQHPIAQLRAFLRYCHDCGEIVEQPDAIDTPRTYRGELPPRALAWSLVQRLLRSVDRASPAGWRDYAILHLMAYYGLRPSEIVAITLDSIAWETKTLRVAQCKTRSTLILPLSNQTLSVLKRYLHYGRPDSSSSELFLRVRTPAGPIDRTAVTDIYEKRARLSGLPLQGTSSYCLRHSFAMRLLKRGVGIKTIGDLLGHRTLESTCVYLRLQTDVLREVALPVPRQPSAKRGGHHASC